MKEEYKSIMKTILFVIIILAVFYKLGLSYIIVHEMMHEKIWERYNVSSSTRINYLILSGTATADSNKEAFTRCNDYCKMEHALNDIAGYYLVILIMSMFSIFCVAFLAYFLFRNKNEKKN